MAEPAEPRVRVTPNGPYAVTGAIPLAVEVIEVDSRGESREWREGRSISTASSYNLCRCGASSRKPFCDGTHARIEFDGTETASRAPYLEQADLLDGPTMELTDAEVLCAFARFCDPDGRVWNLVGETDREDERAKFKHEAGHCPSGRLVAWEKSTGKAFEPQFSPSIGLVEDPKLGVSGPLWVRGGIAVEAADGTQYEVRNRVTLCRCGASSNKPFCDGSHASVGFEDGLAPAAPDVHAH